MLLSVKHLPSFIKKIFLFFKKHMYSCYKYFMILQALGGIVLWAIFHL